MAENTVTTVNTGITMYTPDQATDEAIATLLSKLARRHQHTVKDLAYELPPGTWRALRGARDRANRLRKHDAQEGIVRLYPTE